MRGGRRLLAALLAAAVPAYGQVPSSAGESGRQRIGGTVQRPADARGWRQLLAEGEERLTQGDATGAELFFDEVNRLVHSADAELSLVRTYMHAGQYRRALAFGAHAAGAHPETPAGTALYVWLLHVGGQGRVAAAILREALHNAPGNSALEQARARLSDPQPTPSGPLMDGPWRTAPHAWGATVPPTARVIGSGALIDGGSAALVPTRVVADTPHVWVRNGLGQTAVAHVLQRLDDVGLTLLRLTHALQDPPAMAPLAREPFGGSPNYTVQYVPGEGRLAAWPLLRQGFFGNVRRDGGLRPLGIDVPPGPSGGPVFDGAGRFVGLAVVDDAGTNRVVFASQVQQQFDTADTSVPPETTSALMPVDEIYERGLLVAVQIIVER